MTFKPTVLIATPGQELRRLGRLGPGRLFDGEHSFVLTPHPDGTTRLTHGEHCTGLLVALLKGTTKDNHAGFEACSQALKERSESAALPR